MRRPLIVLLVMFGMSIGLSHQKKESKEKIAEVTIIGEITDLKCYVNGMALSMGDDHRQCAIDCMKGGLPVGILEEKTRNLYVVVPSKGMKGANGDLVRYAERKVKLTGSLLQKNGLKMFLYTKVEGAK